MRGKWNNVVRVGVLKADWTEIKLFLAKRKLWINLWESRPIPNARPKIAGFAISNCHQCHRGPTTFKTNSIFSDHTLFVKQSYANSWSGSFLHSLFFPLRRDHPYFELILPIEKTLQAQEHRAKSSGISPDQLSTNWFLFKNRNMIMTKLATRTIWVGSLARYIKS